MATKKGNYLTKKVKFQGKDMTMYSLDGLTWSTRPEELHSIIERHSTEQAAFTSDLKGEERDKTVPTPKPQKKFVKVHNDDEIDEVIDEDLVEDEIEEDIPDLDVDIDLDEDEVDAAPKGKKGLKVPPPSKVVAPAKKAPPAPVKAPIAASKSKGAKPAAKIAKHAPKAAPKAPAKKAPAKAASKPAKAKKPVKPAKKGKKK